MNRLTDPQADVLSFIKGHVSDELCPPTLQEIADHFEWKSVTAAQQHVNALIRKGYLYRPPGKRRALKVTESTVESTI